MEPWPGLHCSELHWRCPVELSAFSPERPRAAKSANMVGTMWMWVNGLWPGGYCFFPVPRLCGSRQVVAHRSADERIIQMHIQCPSLGSRKWSADHYAVRSLVSPKRQETQNQNKTAKTKTKNNNEKPQKTAGGLTRRSKGAGSLCANELRDLAQKQRSSNRTQGKILRRCQAKQTTQQRRNPGSPLPGSRRSR